jgi:hypothetical protein
MFQSAEPTAMLSLDQRRKIWLRECSRSFSDCDVSEFAADFLYWLLDLPEAYPPLSALLMADRADAGLTDAELCATDEGLGRPWAWADDAVASTGLRKRSC